MTNIKDNKDYQPLANSNIKEYISTVGQKYRAGNATEHTYRGALEQLIQNLLPKLRIVNEPKREKCGAPDYIASQKDGLPVFYIEAKDIGDNDLDGRNPHGHKEQFTRYKQALDNIIFTDYLDFHLYEHGEFIDSVRIAEVKGDKIVALQENEEKFLSLIEHVGNNAIQSITSASRLAKLMAGKARLLANIISMALNDETHSDANDNLYNQYLTFKEFLIQELELDDFADIYAQTIAYGMFAARLHDDTPEDFSREEAGRLIPKTNPFLRNLFNNVAGNELDERIAWVVDDLVTVFQATNLQKIMESYSRDKLHHDPMIHFYEDFLSEYNPKLRKSKGVWYTPQPVVGFIVRAVDEILQKEFNLPEGLADYSMIERDTAIEQSRDKRTADGKKHEKRKFHRVQILDPATGTGTFLAEVVNQIYDRYRDNQGIWQEYVEKHLLPRLNGFEILMASYAVAHIKLDMLLGETGYQHQTDKRLHVYLTNSLEESNNEPRTLFAQWLSREATEANVIKRDYPVMVMIGNPPYSISSQNNGQWILDLLNKYKEGLNERKININDDYIKFIALAQDYIQRNGEGIVGFITNNSYIDGITHRHMRLSLMNTFDKLFILNLHGNSKKRETTPNGGKDENVFDIMQGVCINIFIKTKNNQQDKQPEILYQEIYGKREQKYEYLNKNSIKDIGWIKLNPVKPYYFFSPKDFSRETEYKKGFGINELFIIGSTGIESQKDSFCLCNSTEILRTHLNDLINTDASVLREKYQLGPDGRNWKVSTAKEAVGDHIEDEKIVEVAVSPFDTKFTYLTAQSNGFLAWPRIHSMQHMLIPSNFSIIIPRQTAQEWRHVAVEKRITNGNFLASAKLLGSGVQYPLFIKVGFADSIFGKSEKIKPNFNEEEIQKIEQTLGEHIEPIELFDYIYAVLHSPSYRERYKEFLKIDFPRIPYPTDANIYHALAEKGAELRKLHLMEELPNSTGVSFPVAGSLQVDCYRWAGNRVYINAEQYFEGVPESAWNFYIGGYQPAQKWLKDRKNMTLSFEDVKHYQRIIYVLEKTESIMDEINNIDIIQ
ncbi:MAG: DNA methyltransferase [Prevotella sp.]|nr:DNA methyltransferase [Prevotella sp.]